MKMLSKLAVLGGLSILLLITLKAVGGITQERKQRLFSVEEDIARSYAGPQKICGPFVVLEYRENWTGRKYNTEKDLWYDQPQTQTRTRLFFPEQLEFSGALDVEERDRGIFKTRVFQENGQFSGTFTFPGIAALHHETDSHIELVSAKLCVLVSDPRGISSVPTLLWNESELPIEPGSAVSGKSGGVHASLPDPAALLRQTVHFQMDLALHGMRQFHMVPIAAQNHIRLESGWPHPSFSGDFLAVKRTVMPEGFTAEWRVNNLACSAQQDLNNGRFSNTQSLGVDLINPISVYPMTDRALKYGFLFIFITFSAFFLFELIRQLKIHPVQYGFVGLAQAIFFLLLLSLSEHIGFGISYLIATAATIAVITVYLCGVLKSIRRGAGFGGLLALLYGALFGLLKSEDHALVAGAILLFGLLGSVMIFTRNINWYVLNEKSSGAPQ